VQAINISIRSTREEAPLRADVLADTGWGAWWAISLLLNVASAAGRILANFIISGAKHEYLDPCTTTSKTNRNPQNRAEIFLDL